MMLTQRHGENANAMLAEEIIDPESRSSSQGLQHYRDTLQGLLAGQARAFESPVSPTREMRGKLGELESAFRTISAREQILGTCSAW